MMAFTWRVRRAMATTMVTKPESVTSAGYKPSDDAQQLTFAGDLPAELGKVPFLPAGNYTAAR